MARKVMDEHILRTDYAIRILLSDFEHVDKQLVKGKEKPSCISCYNFASFINIPAAMALFGPLRELWEGSIKGEGFLPRVKGRYQWMKKNWHYHMMRSLLIIDKAFDSILPKKDAALLSKPGLGDI